MGCMRLPFCDGDRNKIDKKAVEEINKKANNSEAVFGIHEGTNKVTIKIVDKQTKETIKEFIALAVFFAPLIWMML